MLKAGAAAERRPRRAIEAVRAKRAIGERRAADLIVAQR
jgi:hypothetical protein